MNHKKELVDEGRRRFTQKISSHGKYGTGIFTYIWLIMMGSM